MRQFAIAVIVGLLLSAGQAAEARVDGDALIGRPFGVAQVSISGM